MFGGLDLKGSGGSTPVKPSNSNDESASAPAPASAFSFLMGSTAPTTSSGSVLQADVGVASTSTAANSSAFSFLSSPPATTTTTMETSTATMTIPSPNDNNANSSSGLSSFNFMSASSQVTAADVTTAIQLPPTSAPSSFDFLQSASTATTDVRIGDEGRDVTTQSSQITHVNNSTEPTAVPPTTASVFDFMSSSVPKAQPSFGTPVTLNSGSTGTVAPAGTGIVFGNAATLPKAAVKKRTRTAKIGAAAQQVELPAPTPPVPQVAPSNTAVASQNTVDVRDAALAASRRAEDFLRSKQEAEATANAAAAASNKALSMMSIQSVPSEDDDVIIAAKAAVKEAKKLSAKSHSSAGVGFGSLFRSRSNNKTPSESVGSASSTHHPAVSLSTSSASMGSIEPAEASIRFQREQNDVKRTVTEKDWRQEILSDTEGTMNGVSTVNSSSIESSSAFAPPTPSIPTPGVRSLMPSFAKSTPPVVLDVISAPKQKTPTDIFQDMLREFRGEVVTTMNEVTRLRQHRAGLLEERFVTNAKERLAVQQKKQAEMHQIKAAENEDFDLADQMSAIIDRYSREKAEYSAILENIGRAIVELDRQKVQCVENVTNCFLNIQTKLSSFKKEQESADTKNSSEALIKFKATSKQLSIEQERLQNDLKHIERDAELIADERKELEKAISEQSGEYEKLRDQARSRLTAVEEEIEELRKHLQQKQKEAAELRTEAAGHDESVLKVRVKFARQLTRLQKKEMTIKDNKEEWEAEKRLFETNKKNHDDQVRDNSESMLARDSLLEALGKEIDMSDTFASIVAKEIGFEVNAGNDEPECDNEMAQMQANVVKCDAAVSESRAALKTVTTVLKNLEDEIQGLEKQLPVLEEIKKTAAEKRDFKGASKASKEIKEASVRLTECKEELDGEIIGRKVDAEASLKKREVELDTARAVANEIERESGMATMKRLADNIKRLVGTKESVCCTSSELSVSGVGAVVLESQIKVLMMEGQAYGDKYGCWTELTSDIDLSAGEPTPNEMEDHDTTAVTAVDATAVTEDPTIEIAEGTTGKSHEDSSVIEKMRRFRDVSNRLKECEESLETSAASEDFEKAAELDDVLQQLLAEVQALNMTDEQMEAALTYSVSDEPITVQNTMGNEDDDVPSHMDDPIVTVQNAPDEEHDDGPSHMDDPIPTSLAGNSDEETHDFPITSDVKPCAIDDALSDVKESKPAEVGENVGKETLNLSESSDERQLSNEGELDNEATLHSPSSVDGSADPEDKLLTSSDVNDSVVELE